MENGIISEGRTGDELMSELTKLREKAITDFEEELEALMKKYDVTLIPAVMLQGTGMTWQIKVVNSK